MIAEAHGHRQYGILAKCNMQINSREDVMSKYRNTQVLTSVKLSKAGCYTLKINGRNSGGMTNKWNMVEVRKGEEVSLLKCVLWFGAAVRAGG